MFTIALGAFSTFPSRADCVSCSKERKLICIMPSINIKGFCSSLKIRYYRKSCLSWFFFFCFVHWWSILSTPSCSSQTETFNTFVDNFMKLAFPNTQENTQPYNFLTQDSCLCSSDENEQTNKNPILLLSVKQKSF